MTLDATLGPVAIELSAPDLLVIVRAFVLEQLRETGELEAAEQQLAEYIRGLVEQMDPTPVNVQTALLNRLLREHDNLRAVLDWLLERGELSVGMRLALYNLGRAGWRLGSWTEALGYLKRATQLSRGQDDTAALIQELCVIAGIALDRRGFLNPSSHSFLERCTPDCRPINSSPHCVLNIQTQYRAVTTVDRQEYTNTF